MGPIYGDFFLKLTMTCWIT